MDKLFKNARFLERMKNQLVSFKKRFGELDFELICLWSENNLSDLTEKNIYIEYGTQSQRNI